MANIDKIIATFERIYTKLSCMYCTNCGAKLREGAKFCHACGKPIARANQAARTVEARNRSTDDVSRTVKAQADKTAVKTEIKEKELDLAKAGAKQILAALKDRNINASATPGEVSCKSDAAQSAFMKMLKKGLICILMLVGFCFSSQAESIFRGLEMDRKIDSEKGITLMVTGFDNDVHVNGALNGNTKKGNTISVHVVFEPRYTNSNPRKSGTAYQQKLVFYIDAWSRKAQAWGDENKCTIMIVNKKTYTSDNGPIVVDASFEVDDYTTVNGYPTTQFTVHCEASTREYDDYKARFPESYPDPFSTIGNCSCRAQIYLPEDSDAGSSPVSSNTLDTEGIDGIVDIDTEADEETGENGWVVPAAVASGLAVGGLALKGRRKKKAAAKKSKKASKEEKKKSDDKQDEDEDDEEKATYEMRIRKDFGDTLTPGTAAQKVFARIVRIPKGGTATTDSGLTSKISITGDDYLNVSGQSLAGGYMSASVEAPQSGSIPDEAVVNFRLAGAGGSFTNRMHFKIAKSEILFFQENLTLPACSDEVWRLPFAVKGASKNANVEVCSSVLDKYDVKIEPGEKDGLFYAVIKEKSKDKKEAGTWEQFSLGIKVNDGKSELEDSLPLYRFHLGLKLGMGSTLPCYLQTDATGKTQVALTLADLVYYDWDPETNDIITVFPVPVKGTFKVSAKGEKEQGYLKKLDIDYRATATTTENGRRIEIAPTKGVLDPPTRFNATLSLVADCGNGREEYIEKEVLIASQPVRQNVTAAIYDEDKRIGDGLINIQSSIWDHGEYSRLFPLYKLIDVMLDGYDGAYGFDKHQVETVKDVYMRFLRGELAGANATAERVTLADEMRMFIDSFLQTSEEVENSMGFFTRMAVGVVTLGMSDVVFTSLQVARDMKATVEKGGGVYDVFVVGVKAAALEAVTDFDVWKGVGKKLAPKQFEAAAKSVENMTKQAREAASDYFSETIGKKTKGILENSKSVKSKVASQADDAIDAFRKHPEMSDLDKKLDQVYKNGQAHGKAKVDDLQAAQWLMENNPTPENVKLYKKKVLEIQRDKFAMHEMNKLADGNSTRAAFNKELDNVYKDVDDDVRKILKQQGYDLDEKPFAATSSNKTDLVEGKKVTFDRDVTYKTIDGKDVPQKAARDAYEKAFYKRTTGIDAPSDKAAREWAQMHDQSVVQKGSSVSYEGDLNPVIKDWDQKLTNAGRTGRVMTYKSTEWFMETEQLIWKANTLEDSGLRLDMLEQALSKRQEAARQMVKQFRYVHERDVAAQVKGVASKISERMRFGMEISSRLFSTGSDALTLQEAEAILAKNNLTLELLSSWLGKTLTVIG